MQLTWQHLTFALHGCPAALRLNAVGHPPVSLAGTMQLEGTALHFAAGAEPADLALGHYHAELTAYTVRGVATAKGVVAYPGGGRFEVSGSDPVELVQRRAHSRVNLRQPVELEATPEPATQGSAPGAASAAVLLDLSVGGGRVETTLALVAGEEVKVRIPAPPAALRLAGRVLWAAGDPGAVGRSAGLQWTGMPQPQRDQIRQLVAAASRR